MLDRAGRVLFRSASGKRLTGWDDEEVLTRPLASFLDAGCLAAALEALAQMIAHPGQTVSVELQVKHQDGSLVEMEAMGRSLLDDPEVAGVVIAAHDITYRKQSEESLRKSRQVLETILNAIPARVFWKDASLFFLGCSEAFARDAGFTRAEEVIGKDDYQMGWRDQAGKYRGDDWEVLESGRAKSLIEETQTTPAGETITLLTSKVPLFDSDGKVSGLLGTYLDITDRKRAETALEASELRYRRLFEATKDGILILDASTAEIVDVNPFLCELLGFSRAEILGRKIWEIGPFSDVPDSRINFRELQEAGYIRYDDLPLETVDGREIAVEFVSNVYRVLDSEVIQCNIRDITLRKQTFAENARLIRAVEQAAESILMTDPQGAIVYVNPAFERISG
ncbi:MAG: PAS domain S-box protein, partial [Thermoanaerobaculia bacterium]